LIRSGEEANIQLALLLAALPRLKKLDARNNPLTHIPQALRQKKGLELWVEE
jgi:hypothetical protein